MAELVIQGDGDQFQIKESYIGAHGDIVIPILNRGEAGPEVFITLNPFEARELIDTLSSTIADYKKGLEAA